MVFIKRVLLSVLAVLQKLWFEHFVGQQVSSIDCFRQHFQVDFHDHVCNNNNNNLKLILMLGNIRFLTKNILLQQKNIFKYSQCFIVKSQCGTPTSGPAFRKIDYVSATSKRLRNLLLVQPILTQPIKVESEDAAKYLSTMPAGTRDLIFFALNDNIGSETGGNHWSLIHYSRNEISFFSFESNLPFSKLLANRLRAAEAAMSGRLLHRENMHLQLGQANFE